MMHYAPIISSEYYIGLIKGRIYFKYQLQATATHAAS